MHGQREEAECLRKLCITLLQYFGRAHVSQALLDVGMALTRGKQLSLGVPFETLNVNQFCQMPIGTDVGGFTALIDQGHESMWRQIRDDCAAGSSLLENYMHPHCIDSLPDIMAPCVWFTFKEASTVFAITAVFGGDAKDCVGLSQWLQLCHQFLGDMPDSETLSVI
eukprot:s1322_g4.t1